MAMHWQHRFNHMVGRYNDIYRVQYLMGHSDISVTMNVYTHISFDDAEEELKRMEEFRKAQAEIEKKNEKPMSQKMFKVVWYRKYVALRLMAGALFCYRKNENKIV